jgi:hypothetical protein
MAINFTSHHIIDIMDTKDNNTQYNAKSSAIIDFLSINEYVYIYDAIVRWFCCCKYKLD